MGNSEESGTINTYIDSHGALMRKSPIIPKHDPRPQWEPQPLYLPLDPPRPPETEWEEEQEKEDSYRGVIVIPLL